MSSPDVTFRAINPGNIKQFYARWRQGWRQMAFHYLGASACHGQQLFLCLQNDTRNYTRTLQGLARINKESVDAIREAVRELERAGYIKRSRERDEHGCLRGTVYTIYEQPQQETENPTQTDPILEKPALENPMLENPILENPMLENPILEKPTLENPMQLNTKRTKKKDKQKTKRL